MLLILFNLFNGMAGLTKTRVYSKILTSIIGYRRKAVRAPARQPFEIIYGEHEKSELAFDGLLYHI